MDSRSLAQAIAEKITSALGEGAKVKTRGVKGCLSVDAKGRVLVWLNISQRQVSVAKPTRSKRGNGSCKKIFEVRGEGDIPAALESIKELYLEKYPPEAKQHRVTFIPGDGVGPEIAKATRRVLEATGVQFQWDTVIAGSQAQDMFGTLLPEDTLESIKKNKVAIKGPLTTPIGSGFRSVNVSLRKRFDLYACLRPSKTYPGVHTPYKNVDIVVVRENTEGLYAGIEFAKDSPETAELLKFVARSTGEKVRDDSAVSLKVASQTASRRIVRFAFEYARQNGRKKVTAIHKANILKFSDGLFLDTAREVAEEYRDIEFADALVDATCMQLVKRPAQFDVLVLPNFYGDFISDLCAGLVGGLGLAPGANIGEDMAIFEPTHGSAPKYAGKNKVNPMAMMLSGVMMLRHLGEKDGADRLERAIAGVIAEGKNVTYDLKVDRNDVTAVGTSQVADAVIEKLEKSNK